MNKFTREINALKTKDRLRTLSLPNGLDLTSNDYLGFLSHPFLQQAAQDAIEQQIPLGAGGSRLLRGHTHWHKNLEEYAASLFQHEAALYFSTGYQANTAIFGCFPDRHDVIIYDQFVHASARESIQNSTARSFKVPHNDVNAFEQALRQHKDHAQNIWVAVESVYSMDGDLVPLADLHDLCTRYGAYLVIDEAHATGVLGQYGQGLTAAQLCSAKSSERLPDNIITLHTCGKALGLSGGLICASEAIIAYMINKARPFIYSTAPSPFQAHLVRKALELCQSEKDLNTGPSGHTQREKLNNIVSYVRSKAQNNGLSEYIPTVHSQIVPIMLGQDSLALSAAATLQDHGFDIRAIRPPTVLENTARLRLSLSADLQTKTLDQFFDVFERFIHRNA